MPVRSDIYPRLKNQFNDYTINAIGTDITINRYTITFDYGEPTHTFKDSKDVKGIIFNTTELRRMSGMEMTLIDAQLGLYLSYNESFFMDSNYHYDLTVDGDKYTIVRIEKFGYLQGLQGIARLLIIAPAKL